MPKTKRPAPKKTARAKPALRKTARTRPVSRKTVGAKPALRQAARPKPSPTARYSVEYREYLERYQFMTDGRPRLSAAEFDKLDDELLDLLALDNLDDDQVIRKQELEYLLLDSES
jgi:hypothetical protein